MDKTAWQGRMGDTWAQEWRRTDRSMTKLTEALLAKTRDFSFRQVLDIGCGAGELSLAIARGRPDVAVQGVDVSPNLIAAAQERGSQLANLSFHCADAASWQSERTARPDLLVSRHGVMFFDDPAAAFGHIAKQAAPGAGLLFSCFRAAGENAFFADIQRLLPEKPPEPDLTEPGPFAFSGPARIEAVLNAAGWGQLAITPFDFPMVVGTGEDAIEDAVSYFARIGPAARVAAELDTEPRDRFFDRVRALAERQLHDGIVTLSAAAWIVTARKL